MAFSGAQVTRLGLYGGSRSPYGSFDGKAPAPPIFAGTIPDISVTLGTTTEYDLSVYFTGATSYAIAPPVETGWTFDTTTGVLTIVASVEGIFGDYVVTGTNAGGNTDSNAFGATVTPAALPGGSSDPALQRKRPKRSKKEVKRLRKFYAEVEIARQVRAGVPAPEVDAKTDAPPPAIASISMPEVIEQADLELAAIDAEILTQQTVTTTREVKRRTVLADLAIEAEDKRMLALRRMDEDILVILFADSFVTQQEQQIAMMLAEQKILDGLRKKKDDKPN